jgi:phosphonate transport system ATP-binding protein
VQVIHGGKGREEMLLLRGLTKRYQTGDTALGGVDLSVPSGQVLGLIGPSGAGKSTLIRCINRLVEPTSGSVILRGTDITSLSRSRLQGARRRMGMIFQEYALVERLTVMENVLSGRLGSVGFWRSWFRRFPAEDVERAFEALDRVGLSAHVNKRADELSGGQRQRVGIARALVQEPDLLLVDEPTASLDPKTSRQIMRLLVEVCAERKLAAIVNIHDVALAQMFVERIVGLRAGHIVFDGAPSRLDERALTEIYGDEDWSKTAGGGDGDDVPEHETTATDRLVSAL